jgi:hypothetical protein
VYLPFHQYATKLSNLGEMLSVQQTFVIRITDDPRATCDSLRKFFMGIGMEKLSLLRAVGKLAIAGEQAGFTLEQMIELLNEGVSVETLLGLISWRLEEARISIASRAPSSGWIV